MPTRALFAVLCLLVVAAIAGAAEADGDALAASRQRSTARAAALRGPAHEALLGNPSAPMARLLADPGLDLIGVLPDGRPLFYATTNLDAAATAGTDAVWPGGWTGLDLDGANTLGDVAVWDSGIARLSHQEFAGRVVVGDGSSTVRDHSTHVMGTIAAAGVEPQARGMSPAAQVVSYNWTDDEIEMAGAAAGGLGLSSHSYGFVTGWRHGWDDPDAWYWFGDPTVSEIEDPGFGFYGGQAAEWDAIAHAAPHYLILKSAGNDRNDFGPDPGGGHYVWDGDLGDWAWSTVVRDPDGGADGFDCIAYHGNAKNLLTVGAVEDIPGGWTQPADVVASTFTGWGPADDGRIKPDVVANGVSLYSSIGDADDAYAWYSGTSMSTPSATGSLNVLRQLYQDRLGATPRASTLKALALHTVSEAGPAPGPDYMFGHGLLNTAAAALLIDAASPGERIFERTAPAGGEDELRFWHDGGDPLKVSLVWTDPPGTPPAWSLNPPDPMLVHDLDLELVRDDDGAVFRPWILDPTNPADPATTGVNARDNVEIVEATGAGVGFYTVRVTHADALADDQVYSLVVTGLEREPVLAIGDAAVAPRLLQAAPNPFNPRTEIKLVMGRAGRALVEVFDARGRRLATLHQGPLAAGEHRVAWDGRNRRGQAVAAGVYLVRLQAGNQVDRLRIALVK